MSSPLSLVAVFILFILLARATWGIHEKVLESEVKLNQAKAGLASLNERETDLQTQVSRLSTEQGVEAEIRTKYKGVRPGESVAVIIGADQNTAVGATTTTASVGWFRGLLQKLGL